MSDRFKVNLEQYDGSRKGPTVRGTDELTGYLVEIDGQNVPPRWYTEDRLEALND